MGAPSTGEVTIDTKDTTPSPDVGVTKDEAPQQGTGPQSPGPQSTGSEVQVSSAGKNDLKV